MEIAIELTSDEEARARVRAYINGIAPQATSVDEAVAMTRGAYLQKQPPEYSQAPPPPAYSQPPPQTNPPPPGMHLADINGIPTLVPTIQASPPPPPYQQKRQVAFFVSPYYKGQNPLPPHLLQRRSQRSFYVSSRYRGNKPKPPHVLRRRNYQQTSNYDYQPSYPMYHQQAPQHYY